MTSQRADLLIVFGAAVMLAVAPPAVAVDAHAELGPPSADLAPIRALIKAKEFVQAIEALHILERRNQTADLYNLLGFSWRNVGEYARSAESYRIALELDPNHRSALEYQGELFIRLGQVERAKENLQKLVMLCPSECEEREDLEAALAAVDAR